MNRNAKIVLGVVATAFLVVFAYGLLTMPDQRSTGERVGDAIGQLENGVDDAARELEPRTPGERIRDEWDDRTDGDPR